MSECLVWDAVKQDYHLADMPMNLKKVYKELNSTSFDGMYAKINGTTYCLLIDEDGKLKEKQIVSGIVGNDWMRIVGNIIFMPAGKGENVGVSSEDINNILNAREEMEDGTTVFRMELPFMS